jgi:uncharacterized protein (DUF1778 family)
MYTKGGSTMTTSLARSSRLNMRLSPKAHEQLRQAAELTNQDVTSFVLGAALQSAREVMFEQKLIELSPQDFRQLEKAIEAPAESSAALLKLFARKLDV